jgi:hypothetical protein
MWADRIFDDANPNQEMRPSPFELTQPVIHNESSVVGTGPVEITTPSQQWAFAVTFPFRLGASMSVADRGPLLVRVEAAVQSGRVGVGCLKPDLRSYTTPEIHSAAGDGRTTFDILVEPGTDCDCLVFRNTADGEIRSRVIVRSIRTFEIESTRYSDLIEIDSAVYNDGARHRTPGAQTAHAQVYSVLLTHSSRNWDWAQCTRARLIERYSDPNRLRDLPPFETLSSQQSHHLYSGGLTLLDLAIGGEATHTIARQCIDSRFKIQHATYVGKHLVLCFEDFLCVVGSEEPVNRIDLRPGSDCRIDDNWFGGLHTVFPVDDHTCIVSSSAADAVLWTNVESRKVIRRWRLPANVYGVNYELTPDMSVADHFIPNDMQLAHLNCAYPDAEDGCYISTLIQGDIGHVDRYGNYSLMDRGHVGCHGVRLSHGGDYVYFTDSCNGRLMRICPGEKAEQMQRVESRWLHDAEQVEGDLYWFCLGDKNEGVVVDVATHHELGRFPFHTRGANVQFATTMRKM